MGRLLEVVPLAARCRQHADLLRNRRQRGLGRRRTGRPCSTRTSFFDGVPETLGGQSQAHRRARRPEALQPFPGWLGGGAMNTPFQWTKQIASPPGRHAGTRWPCRGRHRSKTRAERRRPASPCDRRHPDDLRSSGASPFPDELNGVAQKPLGGVSMMYSFDSADARAGAVAERVFRNVHRPRPLPRRLVGGLARQQSLGKGGPRRGQPRHGHVGAVQA